MDSKRHRCMSSLSFAFNITAVVGFKSTLQTYHDLLGGMDDVLGLNSETTGDFDKLIRVSSCCLKGRAFHNVTYFNW